MQLHIGDCLDVLRTMPDNSVDSIVTDPPYGLSFMGKRWDYDVPSVDIWAECLRVLKPGGHLLAFAGTRTQHRMAARIEDAGFEIRDMIAWLYGSGFPKSLDVSKAIDKAAGAEREVIGENPNHRAVSGVEYAGVYQGGNTGGAAITAPATDAARQWQGWGTGLKPALEPITVARKPFTGTVAANVVAFGAGALNIDACRVPASNADIAAAAVPQADTRISRPAYTAGAQDLPASYRNGDIHDMSAGRWPANVIHDGSDEVVALFPLQSSPAPYACSTATPTDYRTYTGKRRQPGDIVPGFGDSGSAARFFYCAKADRADRNHGCEGMAQQMPKAANGAENAVSANRGSLSKPRENVHPTVKPTDLMRYLCRLVTPPGGTVLDPFMGSGSTGRGAIAEGFQFIGIELDPDYARIAEARIRAMQPGLPLFGSAA